MAVTPTTTPTVQTQMNDSNLAQAMVRVESSVAEKDIVGENEIATRDEEHESKIKEQDCKMDGQDCKMKEQDCKITEHESKIQEQESKIKDQSKITEQESRIKEHESKITEHESRMDLEGDKDLKRKRGCGYTRLSVDTKLGRGAANGSVPLSVQVDDAFVRRRSEVLLPQPRGYHSHPKSAHPHTAHCSVPPLHSTHIAKPDFVAFFADVFDRHEQTQAMQTQLSEQLRRTGSLLTTLKSSGTMIEALVKSHFRSLQVSHLESYNAAISDLSRRVSILESRARASPVANTDALQQAAWMHAAEKSTLERVTLMGNTAEGKTRMGNTLERSTLERSTPMGSTIMRSTPMGNTAEGKTRMGKERGASKMEHTTNRLISPQALDRNTAPMSNQPGSKASLAPRLTPPHKISEHEYPDTIENIEVLKLLVSRLERPSDN